MLVLLAAAVAVSVEEATAAVVEMQERHAQEFEVLLGGRAQLKQGGNVNLNDFESVGEAKLALEANLNAEQSLGWKLVGLEWRLVEAYGYLQNDLRAGNPRDS